jgi:hypothetical protein
MTIKLYKTKGRKVVAYHEAFIYKRKLWQHWGPIGESGELLSRTPNRKISEEEDLNAALADARANGFKEIPMSKHKVVLVEYKVEGMGDKKDLSKITRLFDVLQDILGDTGLGECDGHSIGSGTMEAACYVVDTDLAIAAISAGLKGTKFGDYTRIFEE